LPADKAEAGKKIVRQKRLKVLFISAAVILADQATKFFIKGISLPYLNLNIQGISPGEKHPLIKDIISLTLLENPGFAFGIDPGIRFKLFFTLVTVFITIGLFVYLYQSRKDNFIKKFAAALLIAGAAGNLIDRIFYGILYDYAPLFYGSVVDFISIRISETILFGKMSGNFIFNIADISIAAGLIIMLLSFQLSEKTEIQPLTAENQD
jgi:signal peptidase II